MRKIYFLFSLLLLFSTLQAQTHERIISGRLKSSEDGGPLPGVSVYIKGTTTGTVTDADGRYTLSVPIGSVLVFAFIGLQTREVLVTETGLQSISGNFPIIHLSRAAKWNPSILQDTSVHRDGVTTLTFSTPSYVLRDSKIVPEDIVNIRKAGWIRARLFNQSKDAYVVRTNSDEYTAKGFHIQLSNSTGFDVAGKLPGLQSVCAQGRNINGSFAWAGADQLEVMSWGPSIKTLEYTGTNYAYDRNGTIATAGNGNGKSVHAYDPYQFFRNGFNTASEINVFFPGIQGSTSRVDWSRKTNQGIIPHNNSTINNLSFTTKELHLAKKLWSDLSFLYSSSQGHLMNRGSNLSNIIGSMMRTPATFDISNGFNNRTASENLVAYRLPDGSVRSAAPGYIDNPYGLINELPDQEKVSRLVSALGLNYKPSYKVEMNLIGSYEKQNSRIIYGVFPGLSGYVAGRRTERNEERENAGINFASNFKLKSGLADDASISFGYQFKQERRNVSRMDGFRLAKDGFSNIASADSLNANTISLSRNIHEFVFKMNYEENGFDFQFSNRSYFSNTLNSTEYFNLYPAFTFKANLLQPFYIDFLSELKPFVSISRTVREAPLLFGNNSVLSVPFSSSTYNKYFENKEITWNTQLRPETEIKFETGLTVATHFNLQLNFAYYNNTTSSLILPVWKGGQPVLQNAASVNNRGFNVVLSYNHNYYGEINWGAHLRWTKYNSIVTNLDGGANYFHLAGFTDIQTGVSKGEPFGAIYGTAFLRNASGQKIIGSDGFPLVDPTMRRIGNPIPDYIVSLEPYIQIKRRLMFGFIIDFKKGGQVWNGTKAALNYFGRGQETVDQRNIANYIFDGVNASGIVNTVPVSFYDPSLSLQQNRWVRYGFSGVGEESIQKASWIRLNEVSLSYKFFPKFSKSKKELSLAFVGKNLFLITPYSGVDPGTSLFGYANGTGIDLFNMPSLKSYNFQVTIKL